MPLTKKDKEDIKDIVGEALTQFYDLALKPVEQKVDHVEQRLDSFVKQTTINFEKVVEHLSSVRQELRDFKREVPTQRECNNHEQRITDLEQAIAP